MLGLSSANTLSLQTLVGQLLLVPVVPRLLPPIVVSNIRIFERFAATGTVLADLTQALLGTERAIFPQDGIVVISPNGLNLLNGPMKAPSNDALTYEIRDTLLGYTNSPISTFVTFNPVTTIQELYANDPVFANNQNIFANDLFYDGVD